MYQWKRSLALVLILMLALTGCSSKAKKITQTSVAGGTQTVIEQEDGTVTTIFTPREDSTGNSGGNSAPEMNLPEEIVIGDEGYRTKIPEFCSSYFDEEEKGLYIYVGLEDRDTAIPYIYLVRMKNDTRTPEEYLEKQNTPFMRQTYGDRLVYSGDVSYYQYGPLTVAGVVYRYLYDGKTVENLRLIQRYGNDLISYSVKYWEGDEDKTLEALEMVIDSFRITDTGSAGTQAGAGSSAPEGTNSSPAAGSSSQTGGNGGSAAVTTGEKGIRVVAADSRSLRWQKYQDPSGYFSMEIPDGWAVKVGLMSWNYNVDLISYAITAYDPRVPERMLYFNLNTTSLLKSDTAKQWYAKNYGTDSLFAQMPVINTPTTEGYFTDMAPYYRYSGFRVQENAGKTILGGDLLYGTCTSAAGRKMSGLFSCHMTDQLDYPVQINAFDYSKGTVDAGFYTAWCVVMETAPEEDFVNYQPVLDHCLGSIMFTEKFMRERQDLWSQIMGTTAYIMNNASEISNMIMDTWDNSSRSYDILSQKRSDATLGYDRVYDTETGEYLKAESGFGDWYDGSRYEVVDTDEAYLSPIAGTIYWK